MRNFTLMMLLGLLVFTTSCSDEDPTPAEAAELIKGEWTVQSATFLGIAIPDGSSTLTFDGCSTDCTGVDYEAFDQTSGQFTYVLSADGKTLTIVDNDEAGGSYGGEYDVVTLTSSTLELNTSTILGDIGYTLSK